MAHHAQTFGYTNHTLLPEALETWSVPLFGSVLPRHLEIVYEINRRFLNDVRALYPGDEYRVRRLSLIDEHDDRSVRMAHLACVGSHAINGVAALHSELLKRDVLRDFSELWPERFHNVTNGVTPRRFIMLANPGLTKLVTDAIGDGWTRDLEDLRALRSRRAWLARRSRAAAVLSTAPSECGFRRPNIRSASAAPGPPCRSRRPGYAPNPSVSPPTAPFGCYKTVAGEIRRGYARG